MARSNKPIVWGLFAAGGTVTAFVLPVLILITGLAPLFGMLSGALSYETMQAFVGNWLVKLILFGIIVLSAWHAAHRLRITAHDFGIRADTGVAVAVYALAAVATIATAIALISI